MRRNLIFIIATAAGCLTGGCTTVLIGSAAGVGAYAITQDSVTTSFDASFQKAWKVANVQLKKMGTVDDSFQKLGEIIATVDDSSVHVKISRLTEKTVDIRVSARKNMLPNVELAQLILASIIRELRG
jgi:hypothetical protein